MLAPSASQGPWTAPPPPLVTYAHPTTGPRNSNSRLALILALCVVLVAGAGFGIVALRPKHALYPKFWDVRIQPLADQATKFRGLSFLHPVKATFYAESDFVKLVTSPTSKSAPTQEKTNELRRQIAELRAVGLAQGELNLEQENNTLRAANVLAFYDHDTKSIAIRGTTLTVEAKVTLVHELTHALQDQYFDLRKLSRQGIEAKTDAVRTLIEGDASWTEHRYFDSLTDAERAEYRKTAQKSDTDANTKTSSVPDILAVSQQAPYAFGQAMVAMIRASGGQNALDATFRNPPLSEYLTVNPAALLLGQKAKPVDEAHLESADKNITRRGELGTVGWFSLLSERVDEHAALRAVDGWAGDNYTVYDNPSGTVCTVGRFRSRDRESAGYMRAALTQWKAAMPATAHVTVRPDADAPTTIEFRSCDPGATAKLVTHRSKAAFDLLTTRSDIASSLSEQQDTANRTVTLRANYCAATKFAMTYTDKQLAVPPKQEAAFREQIRTWLDECVASVGNR